MERLMIHKIYEGLNKLIDGSVQYVRFLRCLNTIKGIGY